MRDERTYGDDSRHPIPRVDVCDVRGVRKGGGADLVVVIATPVKNDLRSRQRLTEKIRNYLGFIASDTFAAECGAPSPQNTSIAVHIHPGSDPEFFAFLEECRGWIEDNRARLEIKKGPNQAPEPTTMAVTPRAPSSTSRADHGRGSS
jgi:hypothetical protein